MTNGNYIELSGTAFQQGYAHGVCARQAIRENLAMCRGAIQELTEQGRTYDYDRLVVANEEFVRKESPATLEEIAGIAKGAEVPYGELLQLNLPVYQVGRFLPMDCSQILLRAEATADGSTLLAKARDSAGDHFHQVILRRVLPDERWSVEAHIAGCVTWPGSGVNSDGVAVSTSGNWSARTLVDWDRVNCGWLLMNVGLLLRASTSVAEFTLNMEQHPMLTGVITVVADPSGAAILEATSDAVHSSPVEEPFAVRTNHYLTPELRPLAPSKSEYPSSYKRFQTATEAVAEGLGTFTWSSLAELFAHHGRDPDASICRHKAEGSRAHTLYASIARVEDGAFVTMPGNPCTHVPLALAEDGLPSPSTGVVVVPPHGMPVRT